MLQTDFPYDIIYRSDTYELAKQAGFNDENIWSVVEGDEDNVFTYGPPHRDTPFCQRHLLGCD
jgi:hypothetical protein